MDSCMLRSPFLIPLLIAFPIVGRAADEGQFRTVDDGDVVTRAYESTGWLIQETASFRVFCRSDFAGARGLASACEALRRQLQETWLAGVSAEWSPRCDIVLHRTVAG